MTTGIYEMNNILDEQQKPALSYVEERLMKLKAIKQRDELVLKQANYRKINKLQRLQPKSEDKSDFATNVGFTVKITKDAELLAGVQEYSFIPLDGEARKYVKLVKELFAYHWLTSKTDKQISKVIPSATAYGSGFMFEGTKTIKRKIKVPHLNNETGIITFEEQEIIVYDGIWCEYIDWENFYCDGTDIDNANEAIWVKFWDRKEFIKEHELNPNYKNIQDIPIGKEYVFVGSEGDPKFQQDDERIITEIRYYNKSKDEFIVLANGIEVLCSCIPYEHKELPFCHYVDYQIDDRFYGMGEYELLEEDINYKDAIRSLSIDVIKAQMGIMAMNDDVVFDESTFEYGPFSYMRVDDINGIRHIAPNISTNAIDNAELKVDNDIISKTGIDFKSQQLTPGETATRTASKSQSSKKRINLNLKINGYSFFERLARLRMSNMQLIHSVGNVEIPIEGKDIDSKGNVTPLNGGYGSFTITPDVVKGKYNIIPITESILGITEERTKQRTIEAAQILSGIMGSDGQPVFKGEKIGEMLSDALELDFEQLTSKSVTAKSPEDILNKIKSQNKGVSTNPTDPNSPNFIPAEQRSGANKGVTISGQAKLSSSDVIE